MHSRTIRKMSVALVVLALAIVGSGGPAWAAGEYHQPPWFQWDRATLDVLIVPPNHGQIVNGRGVLGGLDARELSPYENSYLRAVETSIVDWNRAIDTFGAAWLQNGLVINDYVLGRDSVPNAALLNPEIVITTDEGKGVILGIAFSTKPCLISLSKFFVTSFSYEDMYSTSAHEFGHCLGLDHTFGTPEDSVITHDVMHATYEDAIGAVGTHRHCLSNLNVKGVERAFGTVFGQPSGGTVTMANTSYQRISC